MTRRARTQKAKDERRQALIAAALDVFYEKGFAAARMDDIAARAGVSKGTLYLYFDSKEALFAALIETIALPAIETMAQLAEEAPTAREALHRFAEFAPRLVRESPIPRIIKILVGDAVTFPEHARTYRKLVIDRGLGMLAGVLRRGAERGEIEIGDPELTARLVIAPVILSAIWKVAFEAEADAQVDVYALFAEHERMLLRALAPEKEHSSVQGAKA